MRPSALHRKLCTHEKRADLCFRIRRRHGDGPPQHPGRPAHGRAAMERPRASSSLPLLPSHRPLPDARPLAQIAVNYPARAYGITRHEAPAEALKKCPHIRLVHCQTYKNGETEPGYWDDPKPETHKVRRRPRTPLFREEDGDERALTLPCVRAVRVAPRRSRSTCTARSRARSLPFSASFAPSSVRRLVPPPRALRRSARAAQRRYMRSRSSD